MDIPLSTRTAIDELPSLPQILLKLLEAVEADTADFQHLADIIRQDTAIASKIIAIANSSYYNRGTECTGIERALMLLGTETVKTLVITSAIKQFFSQLSQGHHQFLQAFWRRSLITAHFAQALATLTCYPKPDEAYLGGLLTDLGQLVLLSDYGDDYLNILADTDSDTILINEERERLQLTHCDIAADLIENWQLGHFISDAIRYHHEPGSAIQDAHHLVKIIHLASAVSAKPVLTDSEFASSFELFGLNEALTQELHQRITADIDAIADQLNINIDNHNKKAHSDLGKKLAEISQLNQVQHALKSHGHDQDLQQTISRSLRLTFGIEQCLLFNYQPNNNLLVNPCNEQQSQTPLNISVKNGRSLIAETFLTANIQHSLSQDEHPLTVIDKQLIRLCKRSQILALPLIRPDQQQPVGVLVFGVNEQQLSELLARRSQLKSLASEVATLVDKQTKRQVAIGESDTNTLRNTIDETIHEASNPLSIIRNYLEMLNIELGNNHSASENIAHIKSEIDRVGDILLRLKSPKEAPVSEALCDINALIIEIANIFNQSLYKNKNIDLNCTLDEQLKPIHCKGTHLKQILTNLLKNAGEALSAGNQVTISTATTNNTKGRHFAVIIIRDNGPGIPEHIQKQLYKPVQSTKSGNHSGLGLSIAKKLIDEMGASINCRSSTDITTMTSRSGTEFQLLIPM